MLGVWIPTWEQYFFYKYYVCGSIWLGSLVILFLVLLVVKFYEMGKKSRVDTEEDA
jgi:hypothetical protein